MSLFAIGSATLAVGLFLFLAIFTFARRSREAADPVSTAYPEPAPEPEPPALRQGFAYLYAIKAPNRIRRRQVAGSDQQDPLDAEIPDISSEPSYGEFPDRSDDEFDESSTAEIPEGPSEESAASKMTRRRRLLVLAGVIAALLSLTGLAAWPIVRSFVSDDAGSKPPAPTVLTAAVEKRVLTDVLVTRGTVVATTQVQVTPAAIPAAGTALQLVSALYVKNGQTVAAGAVLMDVSGRPLIALHGAVPAYRDLRPNDDGDDVTELQDALAEVGYPTTSDVKGHFGSATKAAVAAFYQHLGYDVPTTGGPNDQDDAAKLAAAQNAVLTAQKALDDSTTSGAGSSPDQRLSLQRALDQANAAQAELIATTGPMFPMAEAVFVPTFPVQVTQLPVRVGDKVSGPVLTLSSGRLSISAQLTPDQGSMIKPGMKAAVDAESLGKSATGSISAVGPLTTAPPAGAAAAAQGAQSAQGAATSPYIPVTITPSTALDPQTWSGQNVRVTITSAATAAPVLVVPLVAVSSSADGTTTVSKLGADNRTVTRVAVRVGISGSGFVEVSPAAPDALAGGDRVVIGQ